MAQNSRSNPPANGASVTLPPETDPEAIAQSEHETISEPGGYKNDPDDATNPNEEIERHKEKLRPSKLRP